MADRAESAVGVVASRRCKTKRKAKKQSSNTRPTSLNDNKKEEPLSGRVSKSKLLLEDIDNEDIEQCENLVDSLEKETRSDEEGDVKSTLGIVYKKRKSDSSVSTLSEIKDEEATELFNGVESGRLKKVKKSKKRKKAKIDLSADTCDDDTNSAVKVNSVHPAIDYLILWKENRGEWSFKKAKQVWLLRNIYDDTKVLNSILLLLFLLLLSNKQCRLECTFL